MQINAIAEELDAPVTTLPQLNNNINSNDLIVKKGGERGAQKGSRGGTAKQRKKQEAKERKGRRQENREEI